ncbi:MAG: prolipoprotein diacylglyceryl transferase [Gemmatimonadetes bacterium]|nr:prolipoprotein diacylglyceryl transferase [Gemmatimonadota bacterium]
MTSPIPAPPGLAAALLFEIPYPQIDPVALDLPGPLDIRWYGLGYLFAFSVGYLVLRKLAREGFLRLDPDAIGDLLFALMLGTILGGRIGYILFYDFAEFIAEPTRIFRIWEGGLSFHGGLIGVLLAAALFARKQGLRFLNLGDSLALGVPFGIFAVRVANFVNGELFGRVASPDVPWAMRFPTDPAALQMLGAQGTSMRQRELMIEAAYQTGVWDTMRLQVPLRHPSQLYEAATEGLLLGLSLWTVYFVMRRRKVILPDGTLGGIFLLGYGLFRSVVELFRQPDAQFRGPDDPIGTVLGPLTMGQTLSVLMILAGLYLLYRGYRRSRGAPAAG